MIHKIDFNMISLRDPLAAGGHCCNVDIEFIPYSPHCMTHCGDTYMLANRNVRCLVTCAMCGYQARSIKFYRVSREEIQLAHQLHACYRCVRDIAKSMFSADDTTLYAGDVDYINAISMRSVKCQTLSLGLSPHTIMHRPIVSSPGGGVFYSLREMHAGFVNTQLIRVDMPEQNYPVVNTNALRTTYDTDRFMRDNVLCGTFSRLYGFGFGKFTFVDLRAPARRAISIGAVSDDVNSAAFVSENLFIALGSSSEHMYDIRACAAVYTDRFVDDDEWYIV